MPKKKNTDERQPLMDLTPDALGLPEIHPIKEHFERTFDRVESKQDVEMKENAKAVALASARTAMKNFTLCKGVVSGVERFRVGKYLEVCLTIPMEANLKAVIPISKFFQRYPIDMNTVNLDTKEGRAQYLERQEKIANRLIGLPTRFLIEDIKQEDAHGIVVCMANRTNALAIIRHAYWMREGAPIKEMSLWDATVVYSAMHVVIICLHGYEKKIPDEILTNRYVTDCRVQYPVGSSIPVAVTEITKEGEFDFKAKLDCIAGELAACKDNLDKLQVPYRGEGPDSSNEDKGNQMNAIATISKIIRKEDQDAKQAKFYAWIEGYDVPAKVASIPFNRFGRPLRVGDRVVCTITGKTDYGYAVIYVRHMAGTRAVPSGKELYGST